MIVNRNELKKLRTISRRNSQNIQFQQTNKNIFNQINIESNKRQNQVQNQYLNYIERKNIYMTAPFKQSNFSDKFLLKQNSNYNNTKIKKQQGFIRSNNEKIYQSKTKNSHLINSKIQQRPFQNPKMSLDVNLSRKGLKQFIVSLPNGINYRQIYSLNISQNKIRQILPKYLTQFQFLKQLNLSNNNIQKVSFPYNKMQLRTLLINNNNISNLNVQHLKNLQSLNAQNNKLIFITLPESLKFLNVSNNQLSNIYFIEKCIRLETGNLSYNMIYDLNFNSFNSLGDSPFKLKKQNNSPRYSNLRVLQCDHNKISHLNGFYNIQMIEELNMEFNDLSLTKENLNQIFQLDNLKKLNIIENPLQNGPYSLQSAIEFIFNKLTYLQFLNNNQRQYYIDEEIYQPDQNHSIQLNDQSSIQKFDQNQNQNIINSDEKPFRLFLDSDHNQHQQILQQKQNSVKKKLKQHYFTLGNAESPNKQTDQLYKIMTEDKQKENEQCINKDFIMNKDESKKRKNQSKQKLNIQQSNQNTIYSNKLIQSQKIIDLQSEICRKPNKITIPISNLKKYNKNQTNNILDCQTKRILNLIFEMSFYSPQPFQHNLKLQISKRLDQQQQQYFLFQKLFQKNKGIIYLRKYYLLQQSDQIFFNQNNQTQNNLIKQYKEQYSFGFINCDNIQVIFKELIKKQCSIQQFMKQNPNLLNRNNLEYKISPIPNSFYKNHIAVRYISQNGKAFIKRSFAPVYYLIQCNKL